MEDKQRSALRASVVTGRRLLEKDFREQLEGTYNILPDGRVLENAPGDPVVRARLLDVIQHHGAGGTSAAEAVDRVAREAAFTVLNRFAALKMAERRHLVRECISQGMQSEGIRELAECAPGLRGALEDGGYRLLLEAVMDEISLDLKVLFHRRDSMAPLWPGPTALDDLLETLNDPQLADVWAEDEAIGWVYQYFNDNDVKEMRDAAKGGAPRNSRELAVRNQFFTPRYVVEFLTDNTLGRLWYEMARGETALRERCRYLVRRPVEIFLKPGESGPVSVTAREVEAGANLSQEELLRQPVHIAHRPLKDPRDIRLLDPACGSMHFGLYAFDLFTVIYGEAWDIAHGQNDAARPDEAFVPFVAFAATFPNKAAFLRDIPRLIVERNIHGIDIDPRAVQIAGLSLWLRAQRAWHDAGVKPADRPRVARSSLVCAEPMPGEKALLHEFVEQQFPVAERPAFAFLLERIFDRMTLAGEAGSLLRIEDDIRTAIVEAKELWTPGPRHKQGLLLPEVVQAPKQGELSLDLSGITDQQFWERAEQRIYDALAAYAEQAENNGGLQRRLFADDAAQGFAFIDLCRRRYDVVLMNPPFGEAPSVSDSYLRANYPLGYIDLYTAFLDRGADISEAEGLIGAITSRTALTLSSYANWRRMRLLGETRVGVCADLGFGVLDSMVEVAAYTLERDRLDSAMVFIDLDRIPQKGSQLLAALRGNSERRFIVSPEDLLGLPNATMAYFLEPLLRADFAELPPVSTFAQVLGGNATSDDERFIRCFWEVPIATLNPGPARQWRWISKGGEYSLFYSSIHLVVDWRGDGGYLGEYMYLERPRNGYLWGPKSWSAAYMGVPGVVWSLRSQKGVSFRALPADCAMSGKSAIVTTRQREQDSALLGILNTERVARLARSLATFGSYEKGAIASLPVEMANSSAIAENSRKGFRSALCANSYLEADPHFFTMLRHDAATIGQLVEAVRADIKAQASLVLDALSQVNRDYRGRTSTAQAWRVESISEFADAVSASDVISELIGFVFGRWDIRYATGERPMPNVPDPFAPLPVCPPGMLQGDDGLALSPEVGRSLRAEGQYPLDVAWDGILVDDPEHPLDVERRVRAALAVLWGDRADALEQEACALLGVPTLRDWFRRPAAFFADHLKRYSKSRRQAPIYWPLSTASGSYTIWVYYHRLTADTLFQLAEHVEQKLGKTRTERLRAVAGQAKSEGRESAKCAKQRSELTALEQELEEMKAELLRVAALPYKPDLSDGVQMTAAPLWRLFRFSKWRKDLETTWKGLENEEYDWAHIAYAIWPDRVREKCKTDRSLAIAHGLEEFCEVGVAPTKKRRKKSSD
jgi:hypothetical protein